MKNALQSPTLPLSELEITFPTLASVESFYQDDPDCHAAIVNSFTKACWETEVLCKHRAHIQKSALGMGIPAFHWLWKLIIDEMPSSFRFLEIGVYKGQVINLIGVLAYLQKKDASVFGITPLGTDGDKYGGYEEVDYGKLIDGLESWSGIPNAYKARILKGSSADQEIKKKAREAAPFDAIYIDGSHDYNMAAHDIVIYSDMVREGGYLLTDDSGTCLKIPQGIFAGHPDATRAVEEILVPDTRFKEVCAISHIRVWRKLKM